MSVCLWKKYLLLSLVPCLFADFYDQTTWWPLESLVASAEEVFKAKRALPCGNE